MRGYLILNAIPNMSLPPTIFECAYLMCTWAGMYMCNTSVYSVFNDMWLMGGYLCNTSVYSVFNDM